MGEAWITGIGLVTALGGDRETSWDRLVAGESGIAEVSLFDTAGFRGHLAAQVTHEFEPPGSIGRAARHLSRSSRLALCAAAEALADAGLGSRSPQPHPWPVILSGGTAGLLEAEGFVARRLRKGHLARGLREFLEVPQDSTTDRVAQAFSLTGSRITVTTACSSATIALGMAADLVSGGETTLALAGGADTLCRLTYAGFNSLRAMDTARCKPFDRRRAGLTLGEGAAILVVEAKTSAMARGARPYARILGYGATNDAFHMTQPEPSGRPWERTIRAALLSAGVRPEAISYINAHGTATEQNDSAEAAAYGLVFGDNLARIPVSSVKGAIGHCLNAAGGIEAAFTALAIARGLVPPTVGFAEADPACPVDPVPFRGRPMRISTAMSSSFAFGGNSAALILERVS